MASPNAAFSELTALTFRHQEKKITDQVTNHNALFRKLKERGNVKTNITGGEYIAEAVNVLENQTLQNFSGFQKLGTASSKVATVATVGWTQKWLSVVESGENIRKNSGPEGLIKLVENGIEVAKATMENHMNVEAYGDGSTTSSISGLSAWITTSGSGTVGGIDSATYTNWRNKVIEMTGTNAWIPMPFASTDVPNWVRGYFNKLWSLTERGTAKTDLIIASNDIYNAYESSVQQQIRYMDTKKAEDGFETLAYKSADVVRDACANFATDAELAYFLNTKGIYLFEHPKARWEKDEMRVPPDQDAVIVPFVWMGNMMVKARRDQGLLKDAS